MLIIDSFRNMDKLAKGIEILIYSEEGWQNEYLLERY
jgi:hypothetical protein